MKKSTRQIGTEVEELVAHALEQRGFELLGKNIHSRFGEIDLLMKRRGTVHVIEVKYQKRRVFGGAQMALTKKKFERLRRTVQELQQGENMLRGKIQFDYVAVMRDADGNMQIQMFENVSHTDLSI